MPALTQPQQQTLLRQYRQLKQGDTIAIAYAPDMGSTVSINGGGPWRVISSDAGTSCALAAGMVRTMIAVALAVLASGERVPLRPLIAAAGPMQLTTAETLVGTWTGRWEAAEGGPEGSLGLVVARVPGREAVVGQFTFVSGAMSRTLRYEGQLENGAVRFPLVDDGRIVLEAAGGSDRTVTADRLSGTWVEHRGALPAPRGTIELERAS